MPHPHWYEQASDEARREYDAFGPWILEVASAADLPPAFRPSWAPWTDAVLAFKIPVDRDRRDARPGQVLYDRVVVACPDRLGFLSLRAGQVTTKTVALTEVAAHRSSHLLLRGDFVVFLRDGSDEAFAYNTVSRPLVERLVDHLRDRLSPRTPGGEGPALFSEAPVADYAFATQVRRHRERRPECRVVACLEPGLTCFDERGRKRRSSGLLVLDSGPETLLLDTGASAHRLKEAVYGSRTTVVPHGGFEGAEVSGRTLTLRVGGRTLTWGLEGETEGLARYWAQIPAIGSAPR